MWVSDILVHTPSQLVVQCSLHPTSPSPGARQKHTGWDECESVGERVEELGSFPQAPAHGSTLSTKTSEPGRGTLACKADPAEANHVLENSLQRRCLYKPSLNEEQRPRITVVTVGYGNVQLVDGQNEPSFSHSYGVCRLQDGSGTCADDSFTLNRLQRHTIPSTVHLSLA
ncbi:hypothetical protein CRENBAI_009390 [Crenichthys baileyi]|uniref:Uncharacterized protein n=1 Tax=Crenichthys baileyi TaxID=28760 RepID=A0AAV9RUB9_9TELE